MRTHLVIDGIMYACCKFLKVLGGELRRIGVWVMDFVRHPIVISHKQRICRQALPWNKHSKESGFISQLHGILPARGRYLHNNLGCRGNQGLYQKTGFRQMRSQHGVGIGCF